MHDSDSGSTTSVDIRYWVLVAVTVVAIVLLALLPPFSWISGLILLLLVGIGGPIVLTIMAIFGRRDLQAFGIGGLFPAVLSFATVVCVFVICTFNGWDDAARAEGLASGAIASFLGIIVCGAVGILIRRSIPSFMARSAPILTGHWQMSISTLLGATAGIAITLTVLFKVPAIVTTIVLVGFAVVITVALTTLVVYARGVWQTFAIGGLFPAVIQLSVTTCFVIAAAFNGWDFVGAMELFGLRIGSGLSWLMIAVCGCLAVRVRRLVEQRARYTDCGVGSL